MTTSKLDSILDLATLEQYCNAIGAGTLLKSVVLFEELMPSYLEALIAASLETEPKDLCNEAHKFKGAAGSVGLKRLQEFAQLLQHNENPEWDEKHSLWLAEIIEHSHNDLAMLKEYLTSLS